MFGTTQERHCPHCGTQARHELHSDCGEEVAWCQNCRRVHLTDPQREAAAVLALAAALSDFAMRSRGRLRGWLPEFGWR